MAEEIQSNTGGNPRDVDASTQLSASELNIMKAGLANPLDFPTEFKSWLEDQIRVMLTAGNISGLKSLLFAVGDIKYTAYDYGTGTSETVVEDETGGWLVCNGAAVSRTTYARLFELISTTYGTGDGSTTFNIPDARGRALWVCGTHTATDPGDNDGVAESSRQIKHRHTVASLGTTSDSAGTPSGSLTGGALFYYSISTGAVQSGSGATGITTAATAAEQQTFSGNAMSGHSHSANGYAGDGMAGTDAVAHIVVGSALIRY